MNEVGEEKGKMRISLRVVVYVAIGILVAGLVVLGIYKLFCKEEEKTIIEKKDLEKMSTLDRTLLESLSYKKDGGHKLIARYLSEEELRAAVYVIFSVVNGISERYDTIKNMLVISNKLKNNYDPFTRKVISFLRAYLGGMKPDDPEFAKKLLVLLIRWVIVIPDFVKMVEEG